MLQYLWEIFIAMLESLLISYLFYKKIGLRQNGEYKFIFSIFFIASLISILSFIGLQPTVKMPIILAIMILVALWAYDSRGRRFKAVVWAHIYLLIVAISDVITISIADMMVDYSLQELMSFSGARMGFTLIYLLIVAVIVWAVGHFGEPNRYYPLHVSIIFLILLGVGLFSAESILDVALVLGSKPETSEYATTLTRLSYGILIMLVSLLITFERLGMVRLKNKELEMTKQLAKLEQAHYKATTSAANSIAEWKHDYHGQLRLIASFIKQNRLDELNNFINKMDSNLLISKTLLSTGNVTIDSVVSLRMMDAKRYGIDFTHQIYIPENVPFSDVSIASLIGNILDNAIEACQKISSKSEILFEMKPVKQMLFIQCSNTSDGNYKQKKGALLSTKKDANHGIGTRRIRDITLEANGTCEFVPESDKFSVSILVPIV